MQVTFFPSHSRSGISEMIPPGLDIDVARCLASFADEITRNSAISISSLKGRADLSLRWDS